MLSVNRKIMDELLKHPHYLQMFENGIINTLIDHYSQAKIEIVGRLARVEDYGQGYTLDYRLLRLREQLKEIDFVMKNATDSAVADLSYKLNEFGRLEKKYYEKLLSDRLAPIGINLIRIPVEQVNKIINTPSGGALYSDRMYKHYGDNVYVMKNALTQSVIQGEDMATASKRLLGIGKNIGGVIGNEISKQSTVIARTEIQRVSNSVGSEIYAQNTDVLKGVEFVATLDDRTCHDCGNLDGKVYYYDENPPTVKDTPPLHPNCRCCLSPITKSWEELGMNAEEVPPSTRASFDGQVPETLTYNDWLKQMNQEESAFVRYILGTKRYEFWNSDQLILKKMVLNNKVLNLKQLAKKSNIETK